MTDRTARSSLKNATANTVRQLLRDYKNNITKEQWQKFQAGHPDRATIDSICHMLDLCSDLTGVALRPAQETTPKKSVAPHAKTCSCKGHMPRKHKAKRKLSCFNNWSLISLPKHLTTKTDNNTASSNPDTDSSDDTSVGVAPRSAQETTPQKSVHLPAKTCSCKEQMPPKHKQIKKWSCFNNWSLISIKMHPKTKDDHKTASSNSDTVSTVHTSVGVTPRPAQETTPQKSVHLPAKTCSCKEQMPPKHEEIKKLSRFNNWSLISIKIHQKRKEDNETAVSNPVTVSSDHKSNPRLGNPDSVSSDHTSNSDSDHTSTSDSVSSDHTSNSDSSDHKRNPRLGNSDSPSSDHTSNSDSSDHKRNPRLGNSDSVSSDHISNSDSSDHKRNPRLGNSDSPSSDYTSNSDSSDHKRNPRLGNSDSVSSDHISNSDSSDHKRNPRLGNSDSASSDHISNSDSSDHKRNPRLGNSDSASSDHKSNPRVGNSDSASSDHKSNPRLGNSDSPSSDHTSNSDSSDHKRNPRLGNSDSVSSDHISNSDSSDHKRNPRLGNSDSVSSDHISNSDSSDHKRNPRLGNSDSVSSDHISNSDSSDHKRNPRLGNSDSVSSDHTSNSDSSDHKRNSRLGNPDSVRSDHTSNSDSDHISNSDSDHTSNSDSDHTSNSDSDHTATSTEITAENIKNGGSVIVNKATVNQFNIYNLELQKYRFLVENCLEELVMRLAKKSGQVISRNIVFAIANRLATQICAEITDEFYNIPIAKFQNFHKVIYKALCKRWKNPKNILEFMASDCPEHNITIVNIFMDKAAKLSTKPSRIRRFFAFVGRMFTRK
ncbi:protein starmaker-like isoform X6 [Oreochromis aureus]|uniref:protein starmaker-like isoform X6 n=1 Tax=Oreochromis aureus TaxID=47969 RepID=UPI00195402A9|nr:protein starmaker-like isoform X6 [Oreochromis aureus]